MIIMPIIFHLPLSCLIFHLDVVRSSISGGNVSLLRALMSTSARRGEMRGCWGLLLSPTGWGEAGDCLVGVLLLTPFSWAGGGLGISAAGGSAAGWSAVDGLLVISGSGLYLDREVMAASAVLSWGWAVIVLLLLLTLMGCDIWSIIVLSKNSTNIWYLCLTDVSSTEGFSKADRKCLYQLEARPFVGKMSSNNLDFSVVERPFSILVISLRLRTDLESR